MSIESTRRLRSLQASSALEIAPISARSNGSSELSSLPLQYLFPAVVELGVENLLTRVDAALQTPVVDECHKSVFHLKSSASAQCFFWRPSIIQPGLR